ncbi:acyl-CoA N-acyltransferase [Boletus reticuloceps]|uniref:histone acetyltransferase n=1 Tax=Boletus reticuloceps TaxID=495285 RepID=A0A8I2YJR3_9AGAM|nr:acyl-CoA N-acyltransferase [Boletus reticuloceps]
MAEPMYSEESSKQAFLVRKNGMDPHPSPGSDDHTFLHYQGSDKQLDVWMSESELLRADALASRTNNGKRKRQVSTSRPGSPTNSTRASSLEAMPLLPDVKTTTASPKDTLTEEDFDAVQRYKQTAAQRNFDKVIFGQWQIKTWYYSPYPLTESEAEESAPAQDRSSTPTIKTSGVNRRPHARTSDVLAGDLAHSQLAGEKSVMWVCDRCFKYMAEGSTWELHVKKCDRRHPPGRKVYQRGAHTIWEVDGAKEKLYCQNLSLFGKLFIDVKTLFFDCDNFFFYILTDADSQRDHVLGFFSKEKFSYDDYNLACIIVLPPYQRKGYGMLMIEFSYELSRKTGKVGTPERPLSDLGLRSYLTYWVATLIRFFRRLLTVLPPEYVQVTTDQWMPDLSQLQSTEDNMVRRKRPKGWDGEIDDVASTTSTPHHFDEVLNALRRIETTSNLDGSATSHVVVRCTLGDIARATNLRVEDAAFALNECGLLTHVQRDSDGAREQIGITREMVEAVAKERRVKEMCMSLAHVLL